MLSEPTRACGSCTACCTVMGVHEIGKGNYEACTHLCEVGCGIYADRPGSCRTFECQWLRGVLEVDGTLDTDLRPDSCGVILDYQPETVFGEVYMAWEVKPGASASSHARGIIDGLQERFLVVTMGRRPDGENGFGTPRFAGPRHLVAHADDVLWRGPADVSTGRAVGSSGNRAP